MAAPASAGVRAFDATAKAGLRANIHSWGGAAADFNADGWEDVLINRHWQAPTRLYRNDEGRFRRVPKGDFPAGRRDRHDCDFADVNVDRRLDLYCTVGGGRGTKRNPNELFIQQPDGGFRKRTGEYRVQDLNGRGRDVAFLNANGDIYPDLFVGNDFPRRDRHVSRNRLFINERGKRFSNGGRYGVNRRVGGQRVQAVDYDRNGLDDLLVCGAGNILYLYRNTGRRFRDVSGRALPGRGCQAAMFARMNGDPKPDLVRLTKNRLYVERQRGKGRFRRDRSPLSVQSGGDLATGRIDRDGRDDLYVLQRGPTHENKPDRVLLTRRGGRKFKRVAIPQTSRGKGDRVFAVDHDRNGRTDFVVTNGRNSARGPVKLIAFR